MTRVVSRVTSDERRQMFLAQQRARDAVLARLSAAPEAGTGHAGAGRQWLLRTAMILTLATGGVVTYSVVEFHPPTSFVEALMPRR
jgi:hypothetical protein